MKQDTTNIFGSGTSNQYATMNRTGTSTGGDPLYAGDQNYSSVSFAPTLTGVISFDYYVATNALPSSGGTGFLMRVMSDIAVGSFAHYDDSYAATGVFVVSNTNGTTNINNKTANSGGLGTNSFAYTADQANTLTLAFNNSASSFTYNSGTVASGYMDVWLNGTKMATWLMNSGSNAGVGKTINGLWIQMPQTVTGEISLDNMSIVPEPTAVALVLFAFGTGILLWSRSRRTPQTERN